MELVDKMVVEPVEAAAEITCLKAEGSTKLIQQYSLQWALMTQIRIASSSSFDSSRRL